jgi:undecaprenyl-diphosphatase
MASTSSYLFVGLLQGLLEWLPISSQGNLVVLMVSLLGIEPSRALELTIFLHVGTGLAAIIYFRSDLKSLILRETEKDQKLNRFLLVATVITGIVGLPFFLIIREVGTNGNMLMALTGVALIATGLIQKGSSLVSVESKGTLGDRDGIIMGLVQGLAAVPGLSRSGLTTSVLLIKRHTGEEAFRISFLMSIPAVFAAAFGIIILDGVPEFSFDIFVSLFASFVSALVSIDVLMKVARRIKFSWVCIVLGVLALVPYVLSLYV